MRSTPAVAADAVVVHREGERDLFAEGVGGRGGAAHRVGERVTAPRYPEAHEPVGGGSPDVAAVAVVGVGHEGSTYHRSVPTPGVPALATVAEVRVRGAELGGGRGPDDPVPPAPDHAVVEPRLSDQVAATADAARAAAARGARVLRAGAPRAGVAGLGASDRSPAGAGEGAGPGLAVGAGARRGAAGGRQDASAPLTAAAHPRTHRRDATGAALVGAVLGSTVLTGAAAGALGAGGRDARGDAPLAHDRAGDGAARAGRGAGVAGAGAGGRRGRTGETIAVAHPVAVTLPPTRLTAGAHATRRGVGDGARDAPDARATVRLGAARRAPPQVDAGGHVHLTRGARAAEGLSHPPVGGARGTDRDHPRRGGGRRHARVLRPRRELRVGDAGAGGQLAARQAAQAGGEAVLTHLGAARRPNRGRPNDTLVAGPGVGDNHRGVAAAREGDGGHREQEGGHDRGEHPRGRNDLLHDNTPWGYEPREK